MSKTISELEEEPAVRERFELIRRMADDLAHELKNPLNAVVINLELVRTRVRAGQGDAALERIDVIEEELRRLHTLLDHTLRLVRTEQQAGRYELNGVLAEVGLIGQVLAKLARRQLTLEPNGEELWVSGGREGVRFGLLRLIEAGLAGAVVEGMEFVLSCGRAGGTARVQLAAPAAVGRAWRSAAGDVRALLGSAARLGEVAEAGGRAQVEVVADLDGVGQGITGG